MTAALSPVELDRLRNILARLSSDFDGERAAAGLLATKMLKAKGMTWADIVLPASAPPSSEASQAMWSYRSPWQQVVRDCLARPGSLRPWEKEFLPSLLGFHRLSAKQRSCLVDIATRVLGRGQA